MGALLLVLAVATACGGGGGGTTPPPPPPPPPSSVTISGVAEFESVPNAATGTSGRLDYAARGYQPIRGATVELVNAANNALASTSTDAGGRYAFNLANPNGAVFVRVRAELKRSAGSGGSWDFSVRDNTSGDALWVVDSARITPTSAAETLNVRAASGWNGSAYSAGARAAGPFAILDVAYLATLKVLTVSPNPSFPPLQMMWSPNNRPAGGTTDAELARGEIGTSFFGLFGTERRLYLLGAADVDTDEYDSHVVAHEWGHYFEDAFSRSDSVGGSHGDQDQLDMRVAFSEGWGNAWSGMALANPRYADSLSTGQAGGFVNDVSQAPTSNRGWYSEASVQYLLWRFHQDAAVGFAPIFAVMNGPQRTSPAATSIHSFAALLKAALPSAVGNIDSLLQSQLITVQDVLASGEANDGGVAGVLPIYKAFTSGMLQTCVSDSSTRQSNKLGNFNYIRFTTTAGSRTLTLSAVSGTTGTDPDFVLTRADGGQVRADSADPDREVLTTTLPAGTHTLVFGDYNMLGAATPVGQRCFNFSLQ